MQPTITIEGKVAGRKKPVFSDWRVPLPEAFLSPEEKVLLRDFIKAVVQQEVNSFLERQEERRLAQILSETQIAQGVERGKVDSGQRDLDQDVDLKSATENALQAFEDGLYFVFIDGEQIDNLDDVIELQLESRATFIRLIALSGG